MCVFSGLQRLKTDLIPSQYLLDAFVCTFFLLRRLRNGMYGMFAGSQFSTSPNLQVTELREDMPVIGKAAVQGRGLCVICSSWGRIITSTPGRSSTEGQSTPVFSCHFPKRAFSLSSSLRLVLEIMLPLFTNVKHSPFTIFHRQARPTSISWPLLQTWLFPREGAALSHMRSSELSPVPLPCAAMTSLPPTPFLFGGGRAPL